MDNVLSFFVPNAYADVVDTTAAPQVLQGGSFSFIIMLVVFFLFLYFAVWRPQSKRVKEQQNLLGSIAKGDEVMTSGGLLGRISKISDQYVSLAIANNVEIAIQKSSIVSVLPKGTLKSIE